MSLYNERITPLNTPLTRHIAEILADYGKYENAEDAVTKDHKYKYKYQGGAERLAPDGTELIAWTISLFKCWESYVKVFAILDEQFNESGTYTTEIIRLRYMQPHPTRWVDISNQLGISMEMAAKLHNKFMNKVAYSLGWYEPHIYPKKRK